MTKVVQTLAACAAAIGLALPLSAHAITLGEPGEALLVPLVIYDSAQQVNTLVGITVPLELGKDPVQEEQADGDFTGSGYTTAAQEGATVCDLADPTVASGVIHWYFFNDVGALQAQNTLTTGCDDFVAFDWGATVQSAHLAGVDGQYGFLVFVNQAATDGSNGAEFAMYGDAAIIQGTWESAAFVPVAPLTDSTDGTSLQQGVDEVRYTGNVPSSYSPLTAGIPLDNGNGSTSETARFDLRYFIDPLLAATTQLVVWLDRNCRGGGDGCNRSATSVQVFDTERNKTPSALDLSKMLNVIDVGSSGLPRPGSATSGFVLVDLPEVADNGSGAPSTAGVAFSLIGFSTPGNAQQLQTALAHERGVK
jgi:hypothetical protein